MSPLTRPYEIIFTEHPEYLYVELRGGRVSPDIIRDYIADILAKCGETGKTRILLYRDIPAVLSEGEVFHTVNESLQALSGKKLALVNPHENIRSAVEFGMTVGQNRGGNYRSFNNVAEAQEWLLG